jgi:hypothetical protein
MSKLNLYKEIKRILDERGWVSNRLADEQGKCCIMGAYAEAKGYDAYRIQNHGDDIFGSTYNFYREASKDPELETLIECAEQIAPDIKGAVHGFGGKSRELTSLNDELGKEAVDQALSCAIQKAEQEEHDEELARTQAAYEKLREINDALQSVTEDWAQDSPGVFRGLEIHTCIYSVTSDNCYSDQVDRELISDTSEIIPIGTHGPSDYVHDVIFGKEWTEQ